MKSRIEYFWADLIDKSFDELLEVPRLSGFMTADLTKEEGFDDFHLEIKEIGVLLTFSPEKILISINLISNSYMAEFEDYYDGFNEFSEILPFGLNWGVSEDTIGLVMGLPDYTGGDTEYFGDVPKWNKYIFGNCTLHFQLSKFGKLEMVTIGSLSLEEYLNS